MGMQLIETIEVGSGGAASIEFTSIPQDGVDLLLQVNGRTTRTTTTIDIAFLEFGGDATSSNYAYILLSGNGTVASSASGSGFTGPTLANDSATANTFGNSQAYISNYTSTSGISFSIDGVGENNATEGRHYLYASKYSGTNAVTSLKLTPINSFKQYSTASLYKITAD